MSWLLGAALLGAVVFVALHFSEGREFARLVERADLRWLALAVALQAATYAAQGEVFRQAPRANGILLPRAWLYELSLAKLFLDQAIPSAGVSSMVVAARALRQRDVPPGTVAACVIITFASYHAAYIILLVVALSFTARSGQANVFVALISALFVAFAAALTAGILAVSGRRSPRITRLTRLPIARDAVGFLREADTRLARSPQLLAQATAWQMAIFALDAATIWVLIHALGTSASAGGVFASFMISSVFRTIGIVPGGLGTYEAASVLTLRMMGVSLAVALSATLVFRGLSFWLPMLPGLWCSRRLTTVRTVSRSRVHDAYWSTPADALAAQLGTVSCLSQQEAEARLREIGPNQLRARRAGLLTRVLAAQLRNPLLLILVFAAVVSSIGGQWIDAGIVLVIVFASVGITCSREYSAHSALEALQVQVSTHVNVVRDDRTVLVALQEIVPGDVVLLSAGSLVPGDGVILEATDFYVSEAVLTGESFPVRKGPGTVAATAPVRDRTNCVFLGTNVRSGTARCLVVRTGSATEFGAVAARLTLRPPETDFDRGIRRFGNLLTSAMLILVLLVFAAHMLRGRPAVETLLFSVALAVGLSPELLPAILSVNLARGAQLMARRGVIVRRLNAVENLGSMDVLCTDKTGTITEGVVKLDGAYDPAGVRSAEVLALAAQNASLETGLSNPLDDAILQARQPDLSGIRKVGEIPFDFVRKRVSVVVEDHGRVRLIAKGAFEPVLAACTRMAGGQALDPRTRAALRSRYDAWTAEGTRVLAVATRPLDAKPAYGRDDECALVFAGFLTFLDRPKEGVSKAIADLATAGVSVKVITGDSALVARHVASQVGLRADRMLTGAEMLTLNDEALWHAAERTEIFVEVDPNQKERIILALKKMGHVVGFLGDGVNDAPAMHAADTSLSVDQAADVAREAADFVLLERSLDVIRDGIMEGRKTFANTLKYILTTTSANLGNMVSMAAASLFLPFLPLLPGQILLNNFLSDIPAIGIADDSVDPELVERPERWDIGMIRRFMVDFGVLSSVFDFLTFGVLLGVFRATPALFRTGWFVESLLTELVIALVVRTRRPFFRSRPGTILLASTAVLCAVAFVIPFLPLAAVLGFVPLPGPLLATMCGITVLYVAAAEGMKAWFYQPPGARRAA